VVKKIVLIVLGFVLLLCGLGGIVPGIVLTAFNGRNVESGYHPIGTPTSALVSQTTRISEAGPSRAGLGTATIVIRARSAGKPIFIGVAPAARVNDFLASVGFDEVRDLNLSPYRVETVRQPGSRPAGPPGDESIWTASAAGNSPTLIWQVADGDYRIVVMNADGTPGVAADAQFGLKIGGVFGLGIGFVVVGIIIFAAGLVLIILGIRTKSGQTPVPGAPGGPGAPGAAPPYPPGGPLPPTQ
jgi:hypothetical protein